MARWRRAWLRVHRWAGLLAGLWLVVIGLSGSFLAFYPEIDRWLNPDWTTPQGRTAAPVPMQQVLDSAGRAMPDRFVHSVFPAAGPHDVHHVWLTPAAEDQGRMWEVLVDPSDGRVLGHREAVPTRDFSRRNLTNAVYTLHYQLLLGDTGSTLVGTLGLLLLLSAVTGIVVWWPRSGSAGRGWAQALRIKRGARGIRLHFDVHRVAAAYSVLLLAVVAFTGVTMSFGTPTRAVLEAVSSVRALPQDPLAPSEAAPIDADGALALARHAAPGTTVRCLWLPGASGPAWRVSLLEPRGIAAAGGRGELWLHPEGGAVLAHWRHADGSGADTYLAWQLPLHDGSVAGLPGRIVVCLLGFVPLVLAVTGSVIWWRKRAARQRRPSR